MIVVSVPRENVNDDVVIVRKLMLVHGSEVASGQVVIEIETSKTAIEMEAPEAGTIHYYVAEGDEVPIGDNLYHISSGDADDTDSPERPAASDSTETLEESIRHVSNAARDAAQKYSVDLDTLRGAWISARDVRAAAGEHAPPDALGAKPHGDKQRTSPGAISPQGLPTHTLERLDLRKRSEISSLSALGSDVRQSTIGVTTASLGRRLREPIPLFADGILDLVVYEASRLMQQFPLLNGFYAGDSSVGQFDSVHAGVSFDRDRSLKVLRIDDSDSLSLSETQHAINSLLIKYEADENLSAELQPATFTVTDLGHTLADYVFPLLNGYQSLIIGIVKRSPREYRLIASFDHRVVEGLYVTRYLEALMRNVASHYKSGATDSANLKCHFCQRSMAEERALGNRGLINVTIDDGDRVMMCRNCFDGF